MDHKPTQHWDDNDALVEAESSSEISSELESSDIKHKKKSERSFISRFRNWN